MHSCTPKKDVSLSKELQKHMPNDDLKNGLIDQVKYRKIFSKIKWIDREYHVQDNADFSYKDVKMYCDTNQFPALLFCGSHPKPHGARGLGNHYHIRFDPNIGHGICAIRRIPRACVACKPMIDKQWVSVIPYKKSTLTTCRQLYLLSSSGII